ncbi:MAG: peptide chain release factor 1 [Negativicutes bacterium]
MLEKLQTLEERYNHLERLISDPDAVKDMATWQKNSRTHSKLTEIIMKFREYKACQKTIEDTLELLREKLDDEMRELAQSELDDAKADKERLEAELRILLLPKDPYDDKDVIMEIRGGAGGEEAALFAGDLFRMYSRYAESQRWRVEMLDSNPTDLGGFKEVVFSIAGAGAYSRLKFESGVHRVQRVPDTESSGRIHTSTVTVAVLPEVEDVDVQISPNDLRIDTYCASGAGGQHVNKTESAVRITHLPTGVVVQCQDEKSQLKNKEQAMRVLRAKVLELAVEEQRAETAQTRKSQVGTGDRSERIRTYNFPQGRMTDHRIGLTLHKLDFIMNGDLTETIDALTAADQSERLKQAE